jgi:predicted nucleotidyltransferase
MGVRGKEKLRRAWTCEEVGERLRPLFEDESVRLVVLFGSLACGEGEGAGDIDIAVGTDDGLDVIGFTNRITRLLHEDAVDVVDLRGAPPLLKARIAGQGLPLYEREPGEFAKFRSLAWRRYVDTEKLRRLQQKNLRRSIEEDSES